METNEKEAMSLRALQSYHQGEVNRIQENLDDLESGDKSWDKLVQEKAYHLDKVQYYAKLINENAIREADREAEKSKIESDRKYEESKRKSERFERITDDACNKEHERKLKKWDVLGKIAAVATGVGLTYGLEKLLNCMPNRNADKFIPRA